MNLSLCAVICCIAVSCFASTLANDTANSRKSNPKNPLKDDTLLDDEDAREGSGFEDSRSDVESSGSGYGPDDEDSEFKIKPKPGGRGSDITIPLPTTTSKSVQSSSTPAPKSVSESPIPDDTLRSLPENPALGENKNTHTNIFDKNEVLIRTTTKKSVEEETTPDLRPDDKNVDDSKSDSSAGVYKVNTPDRDRATSFFAQPGILAAVIGGAVVGLLCAILVVMFIVYRMRKKDEGSYPLEEMKRCPAYNPYMKPTHREFFA